MNKEVNINAAQKFIQNYQAELKVNLKKGKLFNDNQVDKLLKCENQAEVQAYLKKEKIVFKNREQYEEFTTLLNAYSNSKTQEGKYKILKSILDPNVREQSKLLLKNVGLTKETGADFTAYLRSLTNHPPSLQESREVANISLEERRVNNMSMKSFGYLSNAVSSLFSRNKISHYASDEILRAADEIYQRTGSWSEIGIFSPEIIQLLAENNNSFAALFRKMGYSFYYEKTNHIRLNADLILEQIKDSFSIEKERLTNEKPPEIMPKAFDDPAGLALEPTTDTVRKTRPLIGRKADYKNINEIMHQIKYSQVSGRYIQINDLSSTKLMFEALDRLIEKNKGSLDGIVHFKDGNSGSAFEEFLQANPNITFSEIYEVLENNTWSLSNLDSSLNPKLKLNGAIHLHENKILAEINNMVLEKRSKPTETNRKPSSLIGKQSPDITLTNLSDPLSLQAIKEMGGFDY